MQNNIHFNCPNCNSTTYFGKTTMGKKYNNGPYQNVISEIQCSICFMDIPSNLCENISYNELENKRKYGTTFTNHIINWMLLNVLSALDFIGK